MNRVLFIHPKNDYTGSTRVLATEIENQHQINDADVITFYNNGHGFLTNKKIKIHNVCFPKFRNKEIPIITSLVYRICFIIKLFIIGKKFDVFYINTLLPFYASVIARILKKKIIWHVHEKFLNPSKGEYFAEWVFNKTPAHRIFVSNYTKLQYTENKKCSTEIRFNKLSKRFVKNVKFNPISARSRKNVIMISSLTVNKGIDTFIQVCKMLPNLSFTLIISATQDSINDFFSKYNIPSNITILSAVADIQPFLQNTDLLLNLTNPKYSIETFGMTILEAMPYGIPAIVPNIGGPTEIIEHGINGYCVDTSNPSVIVKFISKALSEDNYYNLALNSRRIYFEKLS